MVTTRITSTVFRLSEEREVTETPSNRQDKNPENHEFLIDKIKDAPRTTSAMELENKQREVKEKQLKQEVQGQGKKGMREDVLGIWKIVQVELRRVDVQGRLAELQIEKGDLESKLWNKEREILARVGLKVVKEEGKDKIPGHSEVWPDRTNIQQNEGTLDPNSYPISQRRG